MALSEAFAKNLRKLRAKKGWSQQKLAQTAKISVSYVSMLERGEREPPLGTVEQVARALKVPPISMFD